MLVTFISQCEKNALKRTRRVLDAFANRIGDNVWQTAITEEGLNTVRKLLKDTASRSTAVSCHRVKTRKRTEMVWIVGNKRKFNEQGIVPVNWTTKEVFMDIQIETKDILANTNGQPLSQHLFAVGYLAKKIIDMLELTDSDNLANACFLAGILHDIGKVAPDFQKYIEKKHKKSLKDGSFEIPEDGHHVDTSKKYLEDNPRHNEISLIIFEKILSLKLCEEFNLNERLYDAVKHGIYWHHAKYFRKNNKFDDTETIFRVFESSLPSKDYKKFIATINNVLKDVIKINEKYENLELPKFSFTPIENRWEPLPKYKNYRKALTKFEDYKSDIQKNSNNNLVRTAVISADRLVSAMSSDDLNAHITEGTLEQALDNILLEESTLKADIDTCIQGFKANYPNSERNQSQAIASNALAELVEVAELEGSHNIGVLQGPAGCGKTKIALEWASKTDAKKILWVCPRVQVCLGLLNDLTQAEYLPNSEIEIFTGEFKKTLSNGQTLDKASDTDDSDYFTGDIIITTIDQVINNIISHSKVTAMVDFMQAHVVFDEFHELIPMPAFNLLFAELIEAKKLRNHQANTLLVSATPHDFFVEQVLTLDKTAIIRVDSFNQADYQLEFISYDDTDKDNPEPNPLIENTIDDDKTTFVITNTAQDAQLGFLTHQNTENNVLLHSKYTKEDKSKWFNQVFESFKRDGNQNYQVLRSGPIVQASLNISCERMFTDMTSPENWLQRLGRLDRFDENGRVNIYTTIFRTETSKSRKKVKTPYILKKMHSGKTSLAWLEFIQSQIENNSIVKINSLYDLYKDFYKNEEYINCVKTDIQDSLSESVDLIMKQVSAPRSIFKKSIQNTSSVKMSKNSLRGNSYYVQMAVCEVDENLNKNFINEYAYDDKAINDNVSNGLTEQENIITGVTFDGTKDSNKDLVAYMQKKHHNIIKAKYPDEKYVKTHSDGQLLKLARSPEYPIYLSYTPKDLEPIGGDSKRHEYGIYYVKTNKQPVGSMSLNKL